MIFGECLEISKDVNKSFELTRRWNTVAVITDGTAILGLGDIGPEAGMPVMEGKCALFKAFGDVDAFPICLKTKDSEEIIKTIKLISGSFGGINLETSQERIRRLQYGRQKHRTSQEKEGNKAKGFHFKNANFGLRHQPNQLFKA